MTSDFSEHDLQNLHAMERLLIERGLVRDRNGYWFDPRLSSTAAHHVAAGQEATADETAMMEDQQP